MKRDQRSPEGLAYQKLYNTTRWKGVNGVRARQLAREPICQMCGRRPAKICDHIDPTAKANPFTFFTTPMQSLCKHCHDGRKQKVERAGYSTEVDAAGVPTDPNHPWNRDDED